MADLNALDITQPDGSVIPVSQLDDFQREDRTIVKEWALVEHRPNGLHKFGVGSTAARAAAIPTPQQGNLWIVKVGTVYTMTVYDAGAWRNVL